MLSVPFSLTSSRPIAALNFFSPFDEHKWARHTRLRTERTPLAPRLRSCERATDTCKNFREFCYELLWMTAEILTGARQISELKRRYSLLSHTKAAKESSAPLFESCDIWLSWMRVCSEFEIIFEFRDEEKRRIAHINSVHFTIP